MAIWNSVLSADQLAEVYSGGVPPALTDLSSAPDLVLWLPMGESDTYPTIAGKVGGHNGTMTNMAADDIETVIP